MVIVHSLRRPARRLPAAVVALASLVASAAGAQEPALPAVDEPAAAAPEELAVPPSLPAEPAAPVAAPVNDPVEPPPATSTSPTEPAPPPGPPIQRPTRIAPVTPAPAPIAAPTPSPTPTPPQPVTPAPAKTAPTPAQPRPAPSVAAEPAKPAEPARPAEPTKEKDRRDEVRSWRHSGLIIDLQAGFGGCTRAFCRTEAGHHAAPGARLAAFAGGNIFGVLEVGLAVGWNTLRPRDVAGRNALSLYGLDPARVSEVIAEEMGVPALAVDLSTLNVESATSRAFDVGPSLRVHFIRKGRGLAYVGADIHYQLWRNRYATTGGDMRLDFHGFSAPLRAGGGAYVHRNIAVVAEFNYVISYFVVAAIKHPMLDAAAPLRGLETAAPGLATGLTRNMPHFWNLMVNLRFRF